MSAAAVRAKFLPSCLWSRRSLIEEMGKVGACGIPLVQFQALRFYTQKICWNVGNNREQLLGLVVLAQSQ